MGWTSPARKAWAATLFGLGSLLLFAEVFTRAAFGNEGGISDLIRPGGLSLFGIFGIMLWLVGSGMLLSLLLSKGRSKREGPRQVFLRGKTSYSCNRCGRSIDASRVGYHERIRCRCGREYDLYQDMPWDAEEP